MALWKYKNNITRVIALALAIIPDPGYAINFFTSLLKINCSWRNKKNNIRNLKRLVRKTGAVKKQYIRTAFQE